MNESVEVYELELEPIPPDTIASSKAEIMPLIEKTLRDSGRDDLLSEGQINIQIEKTFPNDLVILIALVLLSDIALETYKELILPILKKRFKVKEKSKKQKKKKKDK